MSAWTLSNTDKDENSRDELLTAVTIRAFASRIDGHTSSGDISEFIAGSKAIAETMTSPTRTIALSSLYRDDELPFYYPNKRIERGQGPTEAYGKEGAAVIVSYVSLLNRVRRASEFFYEREFNELRQALANWVEAEHSSLGRLSWMAFLQSDAITQRELIRRCPFDWTDRSREFDWTSHYYPLVNEFRRWKDQWNQRGERSR